MKPAISIIIPAYNEEDALSETLESIEISRQYFKKITNEDIEVIVVDNMSTDNTVNIANFYDTKVVSEEKHNISLVRNIGVKHSSGEILCFLDADSKIGQRVLSIIYEHMNTGKYIGGGVRFRLDKKSFFYDTLGLLSDIMTKVTRMSGVLIYTDRETYDIIGGFDEKYYCGEDLNFAIKLKHEGKKQGKKFLNIFQCFVITSARKFEKMTLKDLIWYLYLLLKPKKMNSTKNCYPWYDLTKRGDVKKGTKNKTP